MLQSLSHCIAGMRVTKAARHPMAGLFLHLCLLCAWMVQQASPSLHAILCRNTPGLNQAQQNICIEVPTSMPILRRAEKIVGAECAWQFRKNKWNCTGVDSTIFRQPHLPEIRESAFIYALTSAVTAHQITRACSNGDLPTCGCDTSRNGMTTVQGWKWGSCSDNVSYGLTYAQRFLDARELDMVGTNSRNVSKAMVHLHNNAVGRKVVGDNMKLSCKCHGLSGSCAVKTCWRELPTLYEVGDILRDKYDSAVEVEVHVPRSGGPATLHYYDNSSDEHVPARTDKLVYLEQSGNYCTIDQNYTHGRYCIPKANITEELGEYYAPCEDFCCNKDFYQEQNRVVRSCNCRFIWCCEVVCQTCVETINEYRCTG